ATKAKVSNRGVPPDSFLTELVAFGISAPAEIFQANTNPVDIYADIKPKLGPWVNLLHRRAALLETMRVVAGFESGWNWLEGKDVTNPSKDKDGEATGIFQVSFDSTRLEHGAMQGFA